MSVETVARLAGTLRVHALRMVHRAHASHIGSCLSAADILAVLYGSFLRVDPERPAWPGRDRFIMSKGHAAAILYASLAERGFFDRSWLEEFCADGGRLPGHVTHTGVPGVELSTGSLGHGLSVGCGMALAARADGRSSRVVVLLSDGECDEGSIWEAVLFAPHHELSNLIVIVDHNKIQSLGDVTDVLDLHPFAAKWEAFRWHTQTIDGHDHDQIMQALDNATATDAPSVIIADTVKGKGVSFMEDKLAWHYKSPSDEQLAQALRELGQASC